MRFDDFFRFQDIESIKTWFTHGHLAILLHLDYAGLILPSSEAILFLFFSVDFYFLSRIACLLPCRDDTEDKDEFIRLDVPRSDDTEL